MHLTLILARGLTGIVLTTEHRQNLIRYNDKHRQNLSHRAMQFQTMAGC